MQIEKLRGQSLDELFDAILALENREECYQFFDDLCTVNEIQSLSQRLQVAKMIKQGYTYATIEEESGASTATISRVKRSLQWGNDAYTMILDRLRMHILSYDFSVSFNTLIALKDLLKSFEAIF